MPKKPYTPPVLIRAQPRDWLAVLQALRDGAASLQPPVAELVRQPLSNSPEGLKKELALLDAAIKGARQHGTLEETDLETLDDRCAQIRRALHKEAL